MSSSSVLLRRQEIERRLAILQVEREREERVLHELTAQSDSLLTRTSDATEAFRSRATEAATSISVYGATVAVGDRVRVLNEPFTLRNAESCLKRKDPLTAIYLGEPGEVLTVTESYHGKPAVELKFSDHSIHWYFAECLAVGDRRPTPKTPRKASSEDATRTIPGPPAAVSAKAFVASPVDPNGRIALPSTLPRRTGAIKIVSCAGPSTSYALVDEDQAAKTEEELRMLMDVASLGNSPDSSVSLLEQPKPHDTAVDRHVDPVESTASRSSQLLNAEVSKPPSLPVAVVKQKAPKTAGPTTVPKTAGPTTVPKTAAPTTVPKTAAPTAAPKTAGPTAAPTTVPKTAGPTAAPKTAGPTTVPGVKNAAQLSSLSAIQKHLATTDSATHGRHDRIASAPCTLSSEAKRKPVETTTSAAAPQIGETKTQTVSTQDAQDEFIDASPAPPHCTIDSSKHRPTKPITLRVYENGNYGDFMNDRVPFKMVTVRPQHKTLHSVCSLVSQQFKWNASSGRVTELLYDATTGTPISDIPELADGMILVASSGDPFQIPRSNSVLFTQLPPEAQQRHMAAISSRATIAAASSRAKTPRTGGLSTVSTAKSGLPQPKVSGRKMHALENV